MGNVLGDVQQYIDEGYSFRVKTVKNRKYITARKGQMEKSLGPYTEEKWRTITRLKEEPEAEGEKPERKISQESPLDAEINALKNIRMLHKVMNCKHVGAGRVCTYWKISDPSLIKMARDDLSGHLYEVCESKKGGQVLHFRAIALVCMDCLAFKEKRRNT